MVSKIIHNRTPSIILFQETHFSIESESTLPSHFPDYSWSYSHLNSFSGGIASGFLTSAITNIIKIPILKGRAVAHTFQLNGYPMRVLNVYADVLAPKATALSVQSWMNTQPPLPTSIAGDLNLQRTNPKFCIWEDIAASASSDFIINNTPTRGENIIDHIAIPLSISIGQPPIIHVYTQSNSDHHILVAGTPPNAHKELPCKPHFPKISEDCATAEWIHECIQSLTGPYDGSGIHFILKYRDTAKASIPQLLKDSRDDPNNPNSPKKDENLLLWALLRTLDRIRSIKGIPRFDDKLPLLKEILIEATRTLEFPYDPHLAPLETQAKIKTLAITATKSRIRNHAHMHGLNVSHIPSLHPANHGNPLPKVRSHIEEISDPVTETPTDDPAKINKIVRDTWSPIFSKVRTFSTRKLHALTRRRGFDLSHTHDDYEFNPESLERCVNKRKKSSSGPDGIPFSFYRTSWNFLKEAWCDAVSQFEDADFTCPEGFCDSLLFLIPKEPGCISALKLRPISVTNTVYRILASYWAIKIRNILSPILSPSQRALLRDRWIDEAIEDVTNLFHQNIHSNNPFFFLSIDFEKAYDSINRQAIILVMVDYSFPPQLINVMLILLTSSNSYFALPRGNILTIRTKSGVKQGCPVSCYTFILIIDLYIHNASKITFITLVRGYVDDIGLSGSKASCLLHVHELTTRFCSATGMKINIKKSSIILFKICPSHIPIPLRSLPIVDSLRYLGTRVGTTYTTSGIWKDAIANASKAAYRIKTLESITLPRRILIINSHLLSTLYYLMRFHLMPKEIGSQVWKLIRIAMGKYFRIPIAVLTGDHPFTTTPRIKHPIIQNWAILSSTKPSSLPIPHLGAGLSPLTVEWAKFQSFRIIQAASLSPPEPHTYTEHSSVRNWEERKEDAIPLSLTSTYYNGISKPSPSPPSLATTSHTSFQTITHNLDTLPSSWGRIKNATVTFWISAWQLLSDQKNFRLVDDNRCRLCFQHPESYIHLLNACPALKKIIKKANAFILSSPPKISSNTPIQSPHDLFLGHTNTTPSETKIRTALAFAIRIAIKLPHSTTPKQASITAIHSFKSIVIKRMAKAFKAPPPPRTTPPKPPPPYRPPFPNGIYYDGSSLGPGKAAGAGAVLYINGIEIDAICAHFIGTNNDAEYKGFSLAIDLAEKHNISHPHIYGDSNLVTKQITGHFKIHKKRFKALRLAMLLRRESIRFHPHWISRTKNSRADQICFAAMISQELGNSYCSLQTSTARPNPPSPPSPPPRPPPPPTPSPKTFTHLGTDVPTVHNNANHPNQYTPTLKPQFPLPNIPIHSLYPNTYHRRTASTPSPFPHHITKCNLNRTTHYETINTFFETIIPFTIPTLTPLALILNTMRSLVPSLLRTPPPPAANTHYDPHFAITRPPLDSLNLVLRKSLNPKPSFIPPIPKKFMAQKNKLTNYLSPQPKPNP
jgi:ribonuclease HI